MIGLLRIRQLSKRGKAAAAVLMLYALYALATGVVMPPILRSQAESRLSDELKRTVDIGKVRFNPFTLSLTVEDLDIRDIDDEAFVSFREFFVNVDPLASLFKRALRIKDVRLVEPHVRVHVMPDGTPSFADLLASDETPVEKQEEDSGELPPVLVSHAEISGGRIELLDESKSEPFQAEIAPLDVSLSDFGTRIETAAPYEIEASIKDGAVLFWRGDFSVAPLHSQGILKIDSLRLRRLWSYLADQLNFEILEGTAGLQANYVFDTAGDDVSLAVDGGELTTENVKIGALGATEPQITIGAFAVRGVAYDFANNAVKISTIESADGRIEIRVADNGAVNLQTLFAPDTESESPPEVADDASAAAARDADDAAPSISLAIGSIKLVGYDVAIDDASGPIPANLRLSPIAAAVREFSLTPGASAAFELTVGVEDSGKLTAKGEFGLEPLSVETSVDAAQIPVAAFSPYVARGVNLTIDGGKADLRAQVGYSAESGVSIKGGEIEIREFASTAGEAPLVGWKSLAIGAFGFDASGNRLTIDDVQLADPVVAVNVDRQGRVNFAQLPIASPDAESASVVSAQASPDAEAEAPFEFGIDQIRVSNGAIAVLDQSVDPNFSLDVTELRVAVDDLTTDETKISEISVSGIVNRTGSLNFDGNVNPLAASLDGEASLRIAGVGLPAFSAYAGQGIGHHLEKGQIGAEVDWTIQNNRFNSKNHIEVEQLSVRKAPDADASSLLPLGLAVELMKDSSGAINVDIPVHGDLNDPDYSFGKPFADAFVNLITRTATSPFALVGKITGFAGNDLGAIDFAPGVATLDALETQKLEAIGEALREKPSLILRIAGPVDPELDRPALAVANVESKIRSVRFDELKRKGKGPEVAEDVVVTAKDRARILEDLYENTFDQSTKALEKSLRERGKLSEGDEDDERVKAAMVERLANATVPTDDELRELARRRADRMFETVAGLEGSDPSQLEVVDPDMSAKTSDGQIRAKLTLTTD